MNTLTLKLEHLLHEKSCAGSVLTNEQDLLI